MGKSTGIAWTRSTRNFWAGCTKVGPGCDGCYAEAFQRWIRGKNPQTGEANNWGPGAPRIGHLEGAVKDLMRWDRMAAKEKETGRVLTDDGWTQPGFWPVFLNSHSDAFDNEVADEWRDVMWATIGHCRNLTFQIVTKRIGNAMKMVPREWRVLGFPKNVWLIATVVNQNEFERDWPKLAELDVEVRGLSVEPMIDVLRLHTDYKQCQPDWVIIGGESDQAEHVTRPFTLGYAKLLVRDCQEVGAAVFVKQMGSKPVNREGVPHPQKHPKGEDMAEWPQELRVREFPV